MSSESTGSKPPTSSANAPRATERAQPRQPDAPVGPDSPYAPLVEAHEARDQARAGGPDSPFGWVERIVSGYDLDGPRVRMGVAWFVVAIADYRVFPEVRFPGFMEDLGHAASWLVAEAHRFGGDAGRVLLMGHSAGAYNAVMLGLDPARFGAPELSGRISGVVGLSGPYDFYPFDVKESIDAFGRSPEPERRRCGNPWPRMRSTAPGCDEGGILSFALPPSVGTSTSPPRARATGRSTRRNSTCSSR